MTEITNALMTSTNIRPMTSHLKIQFDLCVPA
jgi:hypothetical protein